MKELEILRLFPPNLCYLSVSVAWRYVRSKVQTKYLTLVLEVFLMFVCCKRISGSFRKQLPEDLTINIHRTAGISAKIVASCCTRLCDIHSAEIRLQHRALSYRCICSNLVVTYTTVTGFVFYKKKQKNSSFQWLWAQLMSRTYCVDESAAVLKPNRSRIHQWFIRII